MKQTAVLAVAVLAWCAGCDKDMKPLTWPQWTTPKPAPKPAPKPSAKGLLKPAATPSLPTPSPVRPATAKHVAAAIQPTRAPGDPRRPRKYAILVRYQMITIEVPLGKISSSEKLWSYLDEEVLGEKSLVNLGRNGFRVGTGVHATWSDVEKILKELTHRRESLKVTTLMAEPGKGVPFMVKEKQGEQMIFTFYEDRTCSGETYPPGDNLLTMACTYDPDDPQKIVLSGVPVIRSTDRRTRIVREPAIRMVEKSSLHPFDTLGFQMEMRGGDFVVIGPGVQAARPNSIGHHFLIHRREKGVQWERVLILRPEVVATEVHRAGTAAALAAPAAKADEDEGE